MPLCAVVTCRNKSVTQNLTRGGVSYHRFPRNPNIKEQWIAATGRENWVPSKVATICSDHFEPRHFVLKTGERRYLHSLAVPSRNIHLFQITQPRYRKESSSCAVNPASPAHKRHSPNLHESRSQGTKFSPISDFSSSVSENHAINSSECNEVTSIEVEIMPENRIFLRPRDNGLLTRELPDMNVTTREDDRRVIELMRVKIQEQDLLIRKLKVRNYRLKKRLFSLKSMDAMATES